MKFYSIHSSLNSKVLGHYPQVEDIHYNCDIWDEPKFIEHTHFTRIDFEPITANAVLHDRSKITDLINVSGMGFTNKLLVSEKLKGIFESYRKTGLQFFKSNLIYKGSKKDTLENECLKFTRVFLHIPPKRFIMKNPPEM